MTAKNSNAIYISFLCIIIPIFLIFISVPIVRATTSTSYSLDYNKIMSIYNYNIKISDAVYLTDKSEFNFAFSSIVDKNSIDVNASKPEISLILVHYDDKTETEYTEQYTVTKRTELSNTIHIASISDNILYVKIEAKSYIDAYDDPDTYDEFGDIIQGEHHEKEESGQYAVIDRTDIEFMTEEEWKRKPVSEINLESSETDNSSSIVDTTVGEIKGDIYTQTKSISDITKKETTHKSKTDSSSEVAKTKKDNTENQNNFGGNSNNVGDNTNNDNGDYNNNNGNDNQVYTETQVPETQTATQTQQPTTTTTTSRITTTTTTSTIARVTGIKIETGYSDNNVKLSIDNSHTIKAVITPENSIDKSVTWSSNRTDIATIDSNGKIKAVGTGKAIITVKTNDGGLTASCMVTVS